jgi:tripartite-type tricarboxylate transporter receptor subunit TctC
MTISGRKIEWQSLSARMACRLLAEGDQQGGGCVRQPKPKNALRSAREMLAPLKLSSPVLTSFRCLLAALAAVSLTCPMQPAAAEQFPDRPIRIIVPVGAGGGTDVFARALADSASSALGQPVVVENRPGASGTIGVQQVINASPDGYTVGFIWNSPLTAAPHSVNARYTPDDYVAMFDVGYSAYALCAQPSFPANNLKEMI